MTALDLKPDQTAALAPLVTAYPRGVPVDVNDLARVRTIAGLEVLGLVTIKDADAMLAFATPRGRAFHNRSVF